MNYNFKQSRAFKLLLVIVINIILFLGFYILIEFINYNIIVYNLKKESPEDYNVHPLSEFQLFPRCSKINLRFLKDEEILKGSRPVSGEYYNKKPIILFGCSFTFGEMLKDNETFSYKLSKYTQRPVYNYGFNSCSIQHMVYILNMKNFGNVLKEPPKYIIYTFIPHHINRLYFFTFGERDIGPYLSYVRDKKNQLQKTKFCYSLTYSYTGIRFLSKLQNLRFNNATDDEKFDLMKCHFEESKKLLEQKYPATKFVILKYFENEDDWIMETPRWKELENEGFIIISTYDLIGRSLNCHPCDFAKDNTHPSAAVWDLIVPKLVERLNL